MAIPLIIEPDSRISVTASPLGLKNRDNVNEAIRHNRNLKEARKAERRAFVRREAEIGAEFLARARNRTKTLTMEQVANHYQ